MCIFVAQIPLLSRLKITNVTTRMHPDLHRHKIITIIGKQNPAGSAINSCNTCMKQKNIAFKLAIILFLVDHNDERSRLEGRRCCVRTGDAGHAEGGA